ncbi:hypothetical protein ASPZODRAFT_126480 [Penicilliopsis zonata CBS 506.65]|uniref:F-box domain-containing protein n=1 Tax=Penicilliopsis zonata CBS 506.65 TaxID=1073090 RepID=A0A1L9SU22_9EURO|nr:hypothetical protein ASPZODRAFT_126480 [Penicilliopsis zonata CBS 506.65]OJJ50587.1 hypothetical protein ASPZODRAFT_126480 [Penicilliopsis zonata CBS 506.65]
MDDNAELQSFRRQWREEVARRTKQPVTAQPQVPKLSSTAQPLVPPARHEASDRKEEEEEEDEEEEEEEEGGERASEEPRASDHGDVVQQVGQLSLEPKDDDAFLMKGIKKEPSSALEHFETAVQKEAEGNLGDSLTHYRKAYRLDSAVEKTYRNKHFAHSWKPKPQPQPAEVSLPPAIQKDEGEKEFLPTPELIASFAHLPVPQAEPLIENTPPPPCPISNIPSEVLVLILKHVAMMDPASYCRLSLVCKRFAYHFAHEQHIWKRICQGAEFGFKGMHYSFGCDVLGNPTYTLGPQYTPFPSDRSVQIPSPMDTWSQVFQTLPRIRFTGVYISTVNYTRAGAASSFHSISWGAPIHIVTYYRYLRFYPDGSVISLLTTTEPLEVVPYFTRENAQAARAVAGHRHHHHHHHGHNRHPSDPGASLSGLTDPVPPAAMAALKYTLRGRWHLTPPSPPDDRPDAEQSATDCPPAPGKSASVSASTDPRDLVIETEGVDPKYIYTMHLSLRSSTTPKSHHPRLSAPNTSKNTKLAWKGFWSYNKLTDDWAEFGLRNDKTFVFRRVRGWGME